MTANSTRAYRSALAAVACGAVLLTATPSAFASPLNTSSVASTAAAKTAADAAAARKAAAAEALAAKKAADAAAAAAKKTAAAEAAAARKAAAEAAAAVKKAAAEAAAAAKKAAAEAAAAQKAADAAAKKTAAAEAAVLKAATAAAKKATAADLAASKKAAAEAAAAAKKAAADDAAAQKAADAAAAEALASQKAEAALKAKAAQEAAAKAAQDAADAKAAADALKIPDAPVALTAQRSTVDLNNFAVTWTAPTGAVDHYDVTVYVDGTKTVSTTKATTLNIKGRTLASVYRIEVAARDTQNRGAISTVVLAPVIPGAPSDLAISAVSATAGVALAWSAPTRAGLSGIDHYRVLLVDKTTGYDVSLDTAGTAAVFADADPQHLFEANVTAVTQDGAGLPMTVDVGDITSTSPRGFTAIRDPLTPTQVNLAWAPPVWQASDPITGYEVGVTGPNGITWTAVGLTEAVTLPLALDARAVYSVRAVNASGPSPVEDADVDLAVKTQLPSSSAPVVLSTADHQVDVALYGWVGDIAQDQLVITASSPVGNYRGEQVTYNGSDGVAFRDLAAGVYSVTVVGHDTETGAETALFDGTISVDGDTVSSSSSESSFDAGVGYWHGVYPARHLPRVVSTDSVSFEGAGSMAITATWDSTNANVTAGTSGFGGIPVKAKQSVTVSALGRPDSASDWNMGISWWDANGKEISVARAKRVTGVINAWRPSQSTYTAPAGTVSATAFVEVGGLKSGGTFYVDGLTIKSK